MSATTVFDRPDDPANKRLQPPLWRKVYNESTVWFWRINSKELKKHTFAKPTVRYGLLAVAGVAAAAAVFVSVGRVNVTAWADKKLTEVSRPAGAELVVPKFEFGALPKVLRNANLNQSPVATPVAAFNDAAIEQLRGVALELAAGKTLDYAAEMKLTGTLQWDKTVMYRKVDDKTVVLSMLLKNSQPAGYQNADGTPAEQRTQDTMWVGVARIEGGKATLYNLDIQGLHRAESLPSVTPAMVPRLLSSAFGGGVVAQREEGRTK